MGALIFSNDPLKFDITIGIDHFSFQVKAGNPFCGIKGIPDGIHVIHISSTTDDGTRYGYWFKETKNLFMRRDEDQESYHLLTEPDGSKYESMLQLSSHLMVNYPKIDETNWPELTSFISLQQIETITGTTPPYVDSSMTTREESRILSKKLGGTAGGTDHHFSFTEINFKSIQAIRLDHQMDDYIDKSYYLNHVIIGRQLKGHTNRLLGELQFAFCCALIFGNYGSSMQWHNLIELISFSSELSPTFVATFDKILALQLQTLPPEYTETLLNKQVWNRCLTKSHQHNKLPQTGQIYNSRICSIEQEEVDFNTQDSDMDTLPNIDSDWEDDQEENRPTVASGVYYVKRL